MDPEIAHAHKQMMRVTRTARLIPALLILATSTGLVIAFSFDSIWTEVLVYLGLAWVIWFAIKAAFLAGMVTAYKDAQVRIEQIQADALQENIDWDAGNPLRVVGPS